MAQAKGFFLRAVDALVHAGMRRAQQRMDYFLKTRTPAERRKGP